MNYAIEIDPKVYKYLNKIDKTLRNRIIDGIQLLSQNPRNQELNISKLKGFQNLYRLRVGNYRIIYRIEDNKLLIYIVNVEPRGDVYKKI